MADNIDIEQLQEQMDRLRDEFQGLAGTAQQLGTNTARAAKALKEVEKFKAQGWVKAMGVVADVAGQLGKAMYEGKQGAEAYADTITTVTDALENFLEKLGPLGFVIGKLVGATGKYVKQVAAQSDALYKGYQGLAQAGAAASDGMSGLYGDLKKLSLGVQDLDKFVALVAQNSQSLAAFAGTAYDGRRQLAGVANALKPMRRDFMNLGYSIDDINDSTVSYISLQTRVGRAQTMTQEELAAGASKYLYEMDALQRATGIQRKELEKTIEANRSEQRFRAYLNKVRRTEGDAAADNLEKNMAIAVEAFGPEVARGMKDSISGYISSAEGSQAYLSGVMTDTIATEMKAGIGRGLGLAATAAERTAREFEDLALVGAADNTIGNFAGLSDASIRLQKIQERVAKAQTEQQKPAEGLVQAQTDMRLNQIEAMQATQDFVQAGIAPATKALKGFSGAVEGATKALPGAGKPEAGTKAVSAAGGAVAGAATGAMLGSVIPGIGTAIGAGIGAVVGGLGGLAYGAGAEDLTTTGTTGARPLTVDDYIKFTSGTGDRSHFDKLSPSVQQSFLAMAKDYNAMTGKKLQINSAFRSPDEQASTDSGGNPKAAPGRSLHQQGRAIDIQSSQVRELQGMGLLGKHGFKSGQAFGDPPHIYMDKGGIAKGPESGYPATLHGTEAVIPLPDGKTVPVEIKNQKTDALQNRIAEYLARANRMYQEMGKGGGANLLEVSVTTSADYEKETMRLYEQAALMSSEVMARGLDPYKQVLSGPGLETAAQNTMSEIRAMLMDDAADANKNNTTVQPAATNQAAATVKVDMGELKSTLENLTNLMRDQNSISSKILQVSRN